MINQNNSVINNTEVIYKVANENNINDLNDNASDALQRHDNDGHRAILCCCPPSIPAKIIGREITNKVIMVIFIMDNNWENWGWLESDSDEQSTIVSSFQKSDGYLWSVSLEDG